MENTVEITPVTSWKKTFVPADWATEKKNFSRYFYGMNNWQFMVVLGIAISGLASFVNTYDAWSGINSQTQSCTQSSTLQKDLNIQFIVLIVLSCVAIILGILLAWVFRSQQNQRRLVTLGITTAGIFGILYALSIKFQNASNKIKLWTSWVCFAGFLIIGFLISTGGIPIASVQNTEIKVEATK